MNEILANLVPEMEVFLEYTKNIYIPKEHKPVFFKWAKDLNRHFAKDSQ